MPELHRVINGVIVTWTTKTVLGAVLLLNAECNQQAVVDLLHQVLGKSADDAMNATEVNGIQVVAGDDGVSQKTRSPPFESRYVDKDVRGVGGMFRDAGYLCDQSVFKY